MNKLTKFGAIALLSALLVACGPKPQEEFSQIRHLDVESAPALQGIQQKLAAAQADPAALDSALNEYYSTVDGIVAKFNALDVKDAEVKAYKEQIVSVLKETVAFTKEAVSLRGKEVTPELQKSLQEKQAAMMNNSGKLKEIEAALAKKFGDK